MLLLYKRKGRDYLLGREARLRGLKLEELACIAQGLTYTKGNRTLSTKVRRERASQIQYGEGLG